MPKIKDFEKNHGAGKKSADTEKGVSSGEEVVTGYSGKKRRRPGRDDVAETAQTAGTAERLQNVKVVIVDKDEESKMESQQNNNQSAAGPTPESAAAPKVEIKFPGSEILRAKFSKPFEVAESIATEWVNDGKFEGLPLGHPLAQYFAAKGLQKAKNVERKILESPVTEKVAMQALQAGMKAQEIIAQVRAKVKNK